VAQGTLIETVDVGGGMSLDIPHSCKEVARLAIQPTDAAYEEYKKCCACPAKAVILPNNPCVKPDGMPNTEVKIDGVLVTETAKDGQGNIIKDALGRPKMRPKANPCCDNSCMPVDDDCGCCGSVGGKEQGVFLQGKQTKINPADGTRRMCCPGEGCRNVLSVFEPAVACLANLCTCDITADNNVRDVSDYQYAAQMFSTVKKDCSASKVPGSTGLVVPPYVIDPTVWAGKEQPLWLLENAGMACEPDKPSVGCPFSSMCLPEEPVIFTVEVPGPAIRIDGPGREGPTKHVPFYIEKILEKNVLCVVGQDVSLKSVTPQRIPGCEPVMAFSCSGKNVGMSVKLDDGVFVEGAYRIGEGTGSIEPVVTRHSPTCGGSEYVLAESGVDVAVGPTEYPVTMFTPVFTAVRTVKEEKVTSTAGADEISVGINPESPVSVTVSGPVGSIPGSANPNMRLFRPFDVSFSPEYNGKITISGKVYPVSGIDLGTVGLYVGLGDSWHYVDSVIMPDNSFTASIDDVGSYAVAGKVSFVFQGAYCADCPEAKLSLAYDGGGDDAVVFVHGINADKRRWSRILNDFAAVKAPYRAYVFRYPLSMSPDEAAKALAGQLELIAPQSRDISIVSHSVGGIIAQMALKNARSNGYSAAGKVSRLIMAGQPGLGSPAAEVYLASLRKLPSWETTSAIIGADWQLLSLAIEGMQVETSPGTEYYTVIGTKGSPLTSKYFIEANDAVVSKTSAATVSNEDQTRNKLCTNAFLIDETHLDLGETIASAKIIEQLIAKEPSELGHVQYIDLDIGDCNDDIIVVCGRSIPEAAVQGPCKCGNGVCGVGEDEDNCPADCLATLPVYVCKLAPFALGPLVGLLLVLATFGVAGAMRRHYSTMASKVAFGLSALAALGMGVHYFFCGFTMPLAAITLGFVLSLLGLTFAHLHGGRQSFEAGIKQVGPVRAAKSVNDNSIRQMQEWLEKAKKTGKTRRR
jgi:hypothetical protein